MNKLILFLLLITGVSYGQAPSADSVTFTGGAATTPSNWRKTGNNASNYRLQYLALPNKMVELVTGYQFQNYIGTATQNAINIDSGAITSLPQIGQVIAGGTPKQVFNQIYRQSQPPTASLSGGTVYELTTSNKTHNLSFSYGRQAATATISTAVITPGSLNVFSTQPAQPGTVSGTQSVTTAANTNTTYTLTVTTNETPSKTATATTTDTFLPGRYWGRSSISSPSNGVILAVAGGSKQLSNSKANSGFTVTASGSNYVYYAYPSSLGDLTSITVGGFESLPAFTKSIVSVTNIGGYTQNYNVYTSNNTFSATTPAIVTQ